MPGRGWAGRHGLSTRRSSTPPTASSPSGSFDDLQLVGSEEELQAMFSLPQSAAICRHATILLWRMSGAATKACQRRYRDIEPEDIPWSVVSAVLLSLPSSQPSVSRALVP